MSEQQLSSEPNWKDIKIAHLEQQNADLMIKLENKTAELNTKTQQFMAHVKRLSEIKRKDDDALQKLKEQNEGLEKQNKHLKKLLRKQDDGYGTDIDTHAYMANPYFTMRPVLSDNFY